jgi:CRP-like cAMP-binding protein
MGVPLRVALSAVHGTLLPSLTRVRGDAYLCSMVQSLAAHISKFTPLTHAELAHLVGAVKIEIVKKKEHLLREGQPGNKQYFIAKGCARLYIINGRGNEQTLQFAIENWWIADYLGFQSGAPSSFYVQALENCEVLSIEKTAMEELLLSVPKLERYFRLVMQKAFGASQVRIKYLFTMSAQERYRHMNDLFPEFVRRVPQYMLASYLDISAEFLSKIRAGKA